MNEVGRMKERIRRVSAVDLRLCNTNLGCR